MDEQIDVSYLPSEKKEMLRLPHDCKKYSRKYFILLRIEGELMIKEINRILKNHSEEKQEKEHD